MPKVSRFTLYSALAAADRIPFLKSTGPSSYVDGLIPASGLDTALPDVSFGTVCNSSATTSDSKIFPAIGQPVTAAHFETTEQNVNVWNSGFDFSTPQRITPTVNGLYLINFNIVVDAVDVGSLTATKFPVGPNLQVGLSYLVVPVGILWQQAIATAGLHSQSGSVLARMGPGLTLKHMRLWAVMTGTLPSGTAGCVTVSLKGCLLRRI